MPQVGSVPRFANAGPRDPLVGRRDSISIAGLVILPLIVAAAWRMPLFQDGASYLLEVMTSHSAIRHNRYSVLLVQAPSILALKLARLAGWEPVAGLRLASIFFNLAYASVPLVAIGWSWLLVRRRDRQLVIWPMFVLRLIPLP